MGIFNSPPKVNRLAYIALIAALLFIGALIVLSFFSCIHIYGIENTSTCVFYPNQNGGIPAPTPTLLHYIR